MKRKFTKYPSGYVKASNIYEGDNVYLNPVFDYFDELLHKTYDKAKNLPKPDTYKVGGTYYGGTELHDVYDNDLKLIENGYCQVPTPTGSLWPYEHAWVLKIGGAYPVSEITNELRNFLNYNKLKFKQAGFTVITTYGSGYCLFGIGKIKG